MNTSTASYSHKLISFILLFSLVFGQLAIVSVLPVAAIAEKSSQIQVAGETPLEPTLFRTSVILRQQNDLSRIEAMGAIVLDTAEGSAQLLVTAAQLEDLARLRFEPQAIDDLNSLVNSDEAPVWLSKSLQPMLTQVDDQQRQMNAGIVEEESATIEMAALLASVNAEQQAALATVSSIDDDGDGLTNLEEAWWCTDPLNPNSDGDAAGYTDGEEVAALLDVTQPRSVRWGYGAPFGPPNAWPDFNGSDGNPDTPACNDGDYDTIPDFAEVYIVGSRVPSESTDNDKFDDGQEFFGVTYCPGAPTSCGYGSYPRQEYWNYIQATMPNWVEPPGDNLFVAAFPVPDVSVVPDSWVIERVTMITTQQGEMTQATNTYETSVTDGQSTSIANTETWNEWEEVSESIETPINGLRSTQIIASCSGQGFGCYAWGTTKMVGGALGTGGLAIGAGAGLATCAPTVGLGCVAGGAAVVGAVATEAIMVSGFNDLFGADNDEIQNTITTQTYVEGSMCSVQEPQVNACYASSPENAAETTMNQPYDFQSTANALDSIQYAINQQGQLIAQGLQDISYAISQPRYTETKTNGSSWGGSQTTTNETYEEHTISEGEAFTTEQNWSTAWAVDSSHAADLTFNYTIENTGTEYAREITGIIFNIYLGDDPTPLVSYPAWEQFPNGKIENIFPGDKHNFASTTVPLTLEQMKRIDLGEKLTVILEDFSYGADELFYQNAATGGVTFFIEDGVADNDETVDMYIIPTWGTESVQDVLGRYFPIGTDANGYINSIQSPEFNGTAAPTWYEHYLSDIAWWNIYLTQPDSGNTPLSQLPASAASALLFRFNRDSDRDGYQDRVEWEFYCPRPASDPLQANCDDAHNRPEIHPQPEIVAGYTTSREGNEVTALLSLANLGTFDAYGIDAVMYAPDATTTIGNNTVGGNGRVRPGAQISIGSLIMPPDLTGWNNSTATIYAAGEFTGDTDTTITFTVNTIGTVGSGSTALNWVDSNSGNGTLDLGSSYQAPLPVDIIDGVQIGFNTGTIISGDSFAVTALTPRDTFTYTINSEPYTPPVIVVSYSDPQGSHRFVTPVELSGLDEDLTSYSSQMLPDAELMIATETPVVAGVNNTVDFVINNPHPAAIEDAHLYLNFVADGQLVAEMPYTMTLPTGPTTYAVDWSTNVFSQTFDSEVDNILIAFWTDAQNNIIDADARPLNTFGGDIAPESAYSAAQIDFGTVSRGQQLHKEIAVANTGIVNLLNGAAVSGEGLTISSSQPSTIRPTAFITIGVDFDTSNLPTGLHTGNIYIRTNDVTSPLQTIGVTANIVDSTTSAYPVSDYQPLNEYFLVNGNHSADSILSTNSSITLHEETAPLFFTAENGVVAGKGNIALELGELSNLTPMDTLVVDRYSEIQDHPLSEAMELTELRTPYARVYQWEDGTGYAIVSLADSSSAPVAPNTNAFSSIDCYVASWTTTTAQCGQTHFYVGFNDYYGKGQTRAFIKFDLPSLPSSAYISSGELELYQYAWQGTASYWTDIYRVTSGWSSPTWNNQPSYNGSSRGSAYIPKTTGFKYWPITSLIQDWYNGTSNYGLIVRGRNENEHGSVFYSRDNGSYVPVLHITFSTIGVPSLSTPSTDLDGSYTVSWGTANGATRYELQENYNNGNWVKIYEGSNRSMVVSGHAAGTWCYRVRGETVSSDGSWSTAKCTTVAPPDAPTLSPIDNSDGDGAYTVVWEAVSGVTSYELQQKLDGGNWGPLYVGSNISHSLSGQSSGLWCYQVRASNAAGQTNWSNIECTTVNIAPNLPLNLQPVNNGGWLGHNLALTWQDGGDADNAPNPYREFRVYVEDEVWNTTTAWSQDESWQGLVPEDGIYTWQVEAHDGLESSGWTSGQTLRIYSIDKIGQGEIGIALPEEVIDSAQYEVQYAVVAPITDNLAPSIVHITLPNRTYSAATLDLILAEAVNTTVSFSIDVGNDGLDIWSNMISWDGLTPVWVSSPNLASALNNYLSTQAVGAGAMVDVPIAVSLDTEGIMYLTNAILSPDVDIDPAINEGGISVSDTSPMETSFVTVTATIDNLGNYEAKNVMATFFVTDPVSGLSILGSDFIPLIPSGGSVPANIVWDTSGYNGNVSLSVILDNADQLIELDENNNTTFTAIDILSRPDLQASSWDLSDPEPVVGETITINVNSLNGGQTASGVTLYTLYNGNPDTDGVLLDSQMQSGISGNGSDVSTLSWTPSMPGPYRLFLRLDENDTVNEFDETNNLLWKDVYVGFAGPLLLDSGSAATDPAYTPSLGYGVVDTGQADVLSSCGDNLPEETLRRDPSGEIVYQFDHLLPGHFYHLDLTMRECDSAGRQEDVYIDGVKIAGTEDLSDGEIHRLSLRLDPALYADRTINVTVSAQGIDGAVVAEVNLHDIDYRYADAGGGQDPVYPSEQAYGWLDGVANISWGTLPYQSVRVEQSDNELRYRFDQLHGSKVYDINMTFWQPSGTARIQEIHIDGVPIDLTVNTGDYQLHQETIRVPVETYSDGTITVSIIRQNAGTGAMINEIALEENTLSDPVLGPHFSGCANNTGSNATVVVPTSASIIGNLTLEVGDEIAIFNANDSLCAGIGIWDGTNLAISAWGDDSQTGAIDGLLSGETMSIHIWDQSADVEYANVDVTYNPGNGIYSSNSFHVIASLDLNDIISQEIALGTGWNMISSYVIPEDPNLWTLFDGMTADMILMKNGQGQVFWPAYFINQIGNWNRVQGYQIYMLNNQTLTITGTPVIPENTPITLNAGWNLVSYLRSTPMPIDQALTTITGQFLLVKDNAGRVYWPAYFINQIGDMQPGQGYQIYMVNGAVLTYPANNAVLAAHTMYTPVAEPTHFTTCQTKTGNNATLVLAGENLGLDMTGGYELGSGDEIAVFDETGDMCVGVVKVADTADRVILTVWGDNEQTEGRDGLLSGEAMQFRVWSQSADKETDAATSFHVGDGLYQPDSWHVRFAEVFRLFLPIMTNHH